MTVVKVQQRVVAVEATDELTDLFGNGDKSGHLATPTSGFSRGVPQLIRGIRRQQAAPRCGWVTENRQVPRNAGQATAWALHVWDETRAEVCSSRRYVVARPSARSLAVRRRAA